MGKRILVTGACGHIGSRLIRELPRPLVTEVWMLDNMESQRYPSLFNLPAEYQYRFFEADVRTVDLGPVLDGVDAVVHLAAITNAEASFSKPQEVESVNLEGLKRMADACKERGIRLFFPSSTSVYGSQDSRVDETCTELKPQSPYADSKLAAEQYLAKLGTEGLRFVVCRFGTIFGASIGMRYHTAVNKFIWQAVNGQPISVWKTAWDQKRPYLDLGDCVRAVGHILEHDLFDGEIYNVVTLNGTVEQIVGTIKEFVPSLEVGFVDSAIMNQLSYEVAADKLAAKGFTPSGILRDGVEQSVGLLKGIAQK